MADNQEEAVVSLNATGFISEMEKLLDALRDYNSAINNAATIMEKFDRSNNQATVTVQATATAMKFLLENVTGFADATKTAKGDVDSLKDSMELLKKASDFTTEKQSMDAYVESATRQMKALAQAEQEAATLKEEQNRQNQEYWSARARYEQEAYSTLTRVQAEYWNAYTRYEEESKAKLMQEQINYWSAYSKYEESAKKQTLDEQASYWNAYRKFEEDAKTKALENQAEYWNAYTKYEESSKQRILEEQTNYWNAYYRHEEESKAKALENQASYWNSYYKYEEEVKQKAIQEQASYWNAYYKFEEDAKKKQEQESIDYWTRRLKFEQAQYEKSQKESIDYWTAKMRYEKQAQDKYEKETIAFWTRYIKYEEAAREKQRRIAASADARRFITNTVTPMAQPNTAYASRDEKLNYDRQISALQKFLIATQYTTREMEAAWKAAGNGLAFHNQRLEALRQKMIEVQRAATKMGESYQNDLTKMNGSTNTLILSWSSFVRLMVVQTLHRAFAAMVSGLQQSIQAAVELEKRIGEIRTVSQKAQLTTEEWSRSLIKLSNSFGLPVLDVAEAAYQAISNQIVRGAEAFKFMHEALTLSIVGQATATQSVELLSSVINSYGYSADNARELSAKLFKTVELGRVRVGEMANDFGRLSSISSQLGISFEEVGAAIASMTVQGIQWNVASTFIRNVMLKLAKPSKEMKEFFADIGVSSAESAIAAYGFAGVLQKLEQRAQGSVSELAELFRDIRAITGAAMFAGQGLTMFNDALSQIQNSGASYEKAANEMSENLGIKFKKEMESIKNFFITDFGQTIMSTTIWLSETVGGMVKVLKALKEAVKDTAIIGSMALIGMALDSIALKTKTMVANWISGTATMATTAQAATARIALAFKSLYAVIMANPFAVAFAIFAGLYTVVANMRDKAKEQLEKSYQDYIANQEAMLSRSRQAIRNSFDTTISESTSVFGTFARLGAETSIVFNDAARSAKSSFKEIAESVKENFSIAVSEIRDNMNELKQRITATTRLMNKIKADAKESAREFSRESFEMSIEDLPLYEKLERIKQRINEFRNKANKLFTVEMTVEDEEEFDYAEKQIKSLFNTQIQLEKAIRKEQQATADELRKLNTAEIEFADKKKDQETKLKRAELELLKIQQAITLEASKKFYTSREQNNQSKALSALKSLEEKAENRIKDAKERIIDAERRHSEILSEKQRKIASMSNNTKTPTSSSSNTSEANNLIISMQEQAVSLVKLQAEEQRLRTVLSKETDEWNRVIINEVLRDNLEKQANTLTRINKAASDVYTKDKNRAGNAEQLIEFLKEQAKIIIKNKEIFNASSDATKLIGLRKDLQKNLEAQNAIQKMIANGTLTEEQAAKRRAELEEKSNKIQQSIAAIEEKYKENSEILKAATENILAGRKAITAETGKQFDIIKSMAAFEEALQKRKAEMQEALHKKQMADLEQEAELKELINKLELSKKAVTNVNVADAIKEKNADKVAEQYDTAIAKIKEFMTQEVKSGANAKTLNDMKVKMQADLANLEIQKISDIAKVRKEKTNENTRQAIEAIKLQYKTEEEANKTLREKLQAEKTRVGFDELFKSGESALVANKTINNNLSSNALTGAIVNALESRRFTISDENIKLVTGEYDKVVTGFNKLLYSLADFKNAPTIQKRADINAQIAKLQDYRTVDRGLYAQIEPLQDAFKSLDSIQKAIDTTMTFTKITDLSNQIAISNSVLEKYNSEIASVNAQFKVNVVSLTSTTADVTDKFQQVAIAAAALRNAFEAEKTNLDLQKEDILKLLAAGYQGRPAPYSPNYPSGFAYGGLAKGRDTIPALLSPGEFVVNAAASRKFYSQLVGINSGVRGYASGGSVSMGDMNISVNSSGNPTSDALSIGKQLRRLIRQGVLTLQ